MLCRKQENRRFLEPNAVITFNFHRAAAALRKDTEEAKMVLEKVLGIALSKKKRPRRVVTLLLGWRCSLSFVSLDDGAHANFLCVLSSLCILLWSSLLLVWWSLVLLRVAAVGGECVLPERAQFSCWLVTCVPQVKASQSFLPSAKQQHTSSWDYILLIVFQR